MSNLLIAIAVFVITVVGALFAVPYFVDWNSYRSNFEEEASRVIGRDVQVDGDVTLHLLPTPYFRLEKVRIAETSADLTFFKAESLSIRLSIPPMFRGIIEANEIEFQRPVLRLAVDGKGAWNWQSFAQALSSGGYMPANVTLTSLKIADGILAVHGSDGLERARLEGLNGELSAPALEGPYRFRGAFMSTGAEREIRLATAAPEADGAVRLRASLRLLDTGATYLLDARAANLMGQPRLEGDLTARFPIAGLWQSLPQARMPARRRLGTDEEHKLDSTDAAFDLKATVKADAAGAELSNLSLTFEQGGRPQIVTGSMRATWGKDLGLDMSLSSRWLDLDRITGAGDRSAPIESIAKFAGRLRDFIPGRGGAQVTLSVEQASLGGEAIGPLNLLLKRSDEKLDIQDLRVALPGGSRGELQGTIFDTAQTVAFNGSLALRGTSVARLLNWASGNLIPLEAKADGAFGVRTQLAVANGMVAARDIIGNLAGTSVSGSAQYRWEGRPELIVALDGPLIDARPFIPAGASLNDIYEFLVRSTPARAADGQSQSAARPEGRGATTDLSLRLNAGQLATAGRVYRDVMAVMDLKDGHLRQLQLRVSGDEGYQLEIEGAVSDVRVRPKGSIRGAATAGAPAGVEPLLELLGVPAAFRPEQRRAQAMAPLRLAGSLTFGARDAGGAELVVDGSAGGANVKVGARFDSAAGGWRAGRSDISARVESSDGAKVVAMVLPSGVTIGADPARLLIKAAGVPEEGLNALASLDATDLALGFRGRVSFSEPGLKIAGELDCRAGNASNLIALTGLSPPLRADGLPMSGKLNISVSDNGFDVSRLVATIGGSRVAGKVSITGASQRRHVEASLDTDEVSVARLLGPLLDQRLAIAGVAEAAISGRQVVWPDEPFSGAAFDALEGTVRITSGRLTLGEGLALERARLDLALTQGAIEVSDLSGSGLGGELKGKLLIARAPAGAEVRGRLDLVTALNALTSGDPSRATGPVHAMIEFAGRGLSPRSLVSTLQGRGTIEFGEAKLDALWPGAIPLAADAALKAEPDKMAAAVRRGLASALSTGNLPIAQKTLGLELADGQLRMKSFTVDTREGRVTGAASLDLKALAFESQWRLEAKAGVSAPGGRQLPAVVVFYSGPMASFGRIEPRIDSTALEQELSARKIERDVEELERLRRLDEHRRMMESERLRRQFEQTPPVQRPSLPSTAPPIAPSSRDLRPAAPG